MADLCAGWAADGSMLQVVVDPASPLGRPGWIAILALDAGLLPQWRARPVASRALARRLGLVELGAQLGLMAEPRRS